MDNGPSDRRSPGRSAVDFLSRFTSDEMLSIEIAGESDATVRSLCQAVRDAREIVSDDPRTVAGMDYLVAVAILTPARRDEILG